MTRNVWKINADSSILLLFGMRGFIILAVRSTVSTSIPLRLQNILYSSLFIYSILMMFEFNARDWVGSQPEGGILEQMVGS